METQTDYTEAMLNDFKSQANKLYKALEPMFEMWEDKNKTTLLRVLLQNIQFRGGGSHEENVKKTKQQIVVLKSLAKYENYHLYNYVESEIDMIWTFIWNEEYYTEY